MAADSSASAQANSSAAANSKLKPALTVTTTQPTIADIPLRLAANGNVQAWQEAIIGSEANGLRIQELHVNIGDVVQRGQLLASFVSETVQTDLAAAQASVAEAAANLAEAQANAERARNLQNTGALSAQQIGQYLSAEATAKARLDATKAALAAQQLRMKHTRVLAPDAGVISARTATFGAVVQSGAELFRMIRQGRLEWRAELTAAEMARISNGGEAIVTAPGGAQWKGKVRMVAPVLDAQTRNGLVYVDLQPPKEAKAAGVFKPGMYAKGEFLLGHSAGLTIPQQAIVVRDGFSYVFRLNKDGKVTQVKLQTGRRVTQPQGEVVEVLSGLQAGQTVVVSGAGFLNDGDLVKVVNPAADKPAAAAVAATTASTQK
ncbi:efflux RND transporter periplasmic adaptor subunit [Undibacterium sp. CY7W]|uniref:Efflux RND transporter periplasmic adaptor subunit n=2 Tax=Undibacterium rugosum TaxID=2762291 RepID=A0A923I0P3_9BURK|nr:efflux RND transporter periplasmic adaptor subunit [Undibacterium rugosum]MBR7778906.1 efflux RND transporter periplasmic adaptor subunit [Undibacterium rugosum]